MKTQIISLKAILVPGIVWLFSCSVFAQWDSLQLPNQAQSCLPDGIIFSTQAQIDNFPINYPGCITIEGSVRISGSGITNLNGLAQIIAIQGELWMENNPQLTDFNGLNQLRSVGQQLTLALWRANDLSAFQNLDSIGTDLVITGSPNLTSLNGLGKLRHVRGLLLAWCDVLTSLSGMDSLRRLTALGIRNCPLTDFSGLENLRSISTELAVYLLPELASMNGLGNLDTLGDLRITECRKLASLTGLGAIKQLGTLAITGSEFNGFTPLPNLRGLDSLETITGDLDLMYLYFLDSLSGLERLTNVGGNVTFEGVGTRSLAALSQLSAIGETLKIQFSSVQDLQGLNALQSVKHLHFYRNSLKTLDGLDKLQQLEGDLSIVFHDSLTNINGLAALQNVSGKIEIFNNDLLSDCAIEVICSRLNNEAGSLPNVYGNAYGCESLAAISFQCGGIFLLAQVLLDRNGNCLADATDTPASDALVLLEGDNQSIMRSSDGSGRVPFHYLPTDLLELSLPQYPAGNWGVCQEPLLVDPDTLTGAYVPTLLLQPLNPCPEITVDLGLPAVFRGCLVSSHISVLLNNTGTIDIPDITVAVVLPPVMSMYVSWPSPSSSNGDTIFYDFAGIHLPPFAPVGILLEVGTNCDTFLFGQTLCVEAFTLFDDPCAVTPVSFSETKLSASCLGDSLVRLTIRNIGDAPTVAPHGYDLYKNATLHDSKPFSLNAHQSISIDLPADGSTWRMEATKRNDGALTATALENCGGLSPGFITDFWLDEGPPEYAVDCREVVTAYDPNQKSAFPAGAGLGNTLAPNQPLTYTIDFQNTGTDTAFRVLLRDILSPNLDASTFRPIASSHPNVWEIRNMDTLDVLFLPIFLPDSNANEPASHGYFTFEINQKPDLPDGALLENTATIIFDFNPPIITNTVQHTIGRMTVQVDAPQHHARLWQLYGNPTSDAATFRTLEYLGGEKHFELYNANGRLVQIARFDGQSFEFRRDGLPGGWYVFRISDDQGRRFTGQIVVTE